MNRRCKRSDLEASVATWSRWTVGDDGYGQEMVQEHPTDISDVEEYHCTNCDLYFLPGDGGVGGYCIEGAWQRALDHLRPRKGAA